MEKDCFYISNKNFMSIFDQLSHEEHPPLLLELSQPLIRKLSNAYIEYGSPATLIHEGNHIDGFMMVSDTILFFREIDSQGKIIMLWEISFAKMIRSETIIQKVKRFSYFFEKRDQNMTFSVDDNHHSDIWREILGPKVLNMDIHMHFTPKSTLGEGGFGKVFLVERKSDHKMFAAKAFKKSGLIQKPHRIGMIKTETELLIDLRHPNIVSFEEAHETFNTIYIIMEYIRGVPLIKTIGDKPVDTAQRRKIMKDLLNALVYLRNRRIIHRDIKPDNIIITPSLEVKLIDFGVGFYLCGKENEEQKKVGTVGYVAPEIMAQNNEEPILYDTRCDLYSAGIIHYCLIIGRSPFDSGSRDDVLMNNLKAIVDFSHPNFCVCSESEMYAIKSLLEKDPELRLKIQDVLTLDFFNCEYDKDTDLEDSQSNESSSIGEIRHFNSMERINKHALADKKYQDDKRKTRSHCWDSIK